MEKSRNHYVYSHINAAGQTFYIGSGKHQKLNKYQRAKCKTRSEEWKAVAQNGYTVEILADHLTKKAARRMEEHYIDLYYDKLVNVHIGDKRTKEQKTNNLENIAVKQFDLDGNFIAEYVSAHEANRQTGISQGNISRCCRGEKPTARGYTFRYSDKNYKPKQHKKPILQMKDDEVVAEYDSLSSAARAFGCTTQNISHHLKGRSKSAMGFQFKYKN